MIKKKARLLSAIAVIVMLVSMVSGFAVPAAAENEASTQNYRESLKILAVGNSFSRDAMQYLWNIAKDGGVEDVVLGVLYIGGCSLDKHYENISGDAAAYTYYKNTAGSWKSTASTSVATALKDEQWDIITVQQASGSSGQADSFSNLQNILDYLDTNKPKADTKIYWHMTWAYQSDSTHSDFANYNKEQWMMYQFILNAVQSQVVGKELIEGIIPCGTAIQNLRNTAVGDTVTRDGYHMSYDIGRYTAALLWFHYFTGLAPETIQWLPADYADKITPYLSEIYESVKKAVKEPYRVSAKAPQAALIYDQTAGSWKAWSDGSYCVTEDYTATAVGTGTHYDDEGIFSKKAIGFNDTTTYLEFNAKNGKAFGGTTGTTVTFWMRKTESHSDHFESFIVSQGNDGATGVICSDSMYLFPYTDVEDRWYAKMSNFYKPDYKKTKFSTCVDWCKYTAVITETDVRVYYNDILWYYYNGTKSLNRSTGAKEPTHTASEIAKALYEGFTAQNGFFRLRGGRTTDRNTTTSLFDHIKVYNEALSGPEVAALYEEDLDRLNGDYYEITYVLDGGTNHAENPTDISVINGMVELKPATKYGYVFDGWYIGDEKVTHLQATGEAVEVTARWRSLPCDTNKDGRVSIYDAVYFLRALNGVESLFAEAECDYDQDGTLTTADALLLLKHIDGVVNLDPNDVE